MPIVPGTNPALQTWNGQNFVVSDGSAQNPISLPNLEISQDQANYVIGTNNTGRLSYYNPLNLTNGNNLEVTATGSTTARTLANRFADVVNVKDFGAIGDGVTDDTAAIQAAINYCQTNGLCLNFAAGVYSISSITIGASASSIQIYFNSATLKANATTATNCLVQFAGYACLIYGLTINMNLNTNYTCALWWYNATAPAQYNTFYNLKFLFAKRGLVYGALPGNTSTSYAQSENSIFGWQNIGVQNPCYLNHQNGVLVIDGAQMIAHDDGWASQTPNIFNYSASRSFEAYAGVAVFSSGEIQNSIANTSNGYVAELQGGKIYLNDMITECDVPFIINGNLIITGGRILNTQSITSQFYFPSSANSYSSLYVSDCHIFRNNGVGSFSARSMVDNAGCSSNIEYKFTNCNIEEWASFIPLVGSNNQSAIFSGCRWLPANITTAGTPIYKLDTIENSLLDSILTIDTQGNTTSGWYALSGGETPTFSLSIDVPSGTSYTHSIQCTTTVANGAVTTANATSLSTIQATCFSVKPGDQFLVEGWICLSSGNQGSLLLSSFDKNGSLVEFTKVVSQFNSVVNSSWNYLRNIVTVPSGAAYIGVGGASAGASTVRFIGLKMRRANWIMN